MITLLTCHKDRPDLAHRSHSRVAGLPPRGIRNSKALLELAEARDVPVRWSCQTGVCHTCMTGLIDGPITYNPELPEMASSALLEPMPTKAIIAAWKGRARIPLPAGKIWRLAVDTSRTAPDDLFDPGKEPSMQGQIGFRLEPRSSAILLTDDGEVLRDN